MLRQPECHITATGWSIPVLTVTSGASVARTQNTTIARDCWDLLGPAASCPLTTCLLPGEGGRGEVSSQDIEWREGGREEGDVASQSPQHYLDTGRT